jgi:hypothetical protein
MREELIRTSPTKNRSNTEGSYKSQHSDEFFTKPPSPELQTQTGNAVIMLHSGDVQIRVFTRQFNNKGYTPVIIPKPALKSASEVYIAQLRSLEIFEPGLFLLEANYGFPSDKSANIPLLQFILEEVRPTYCLVYSSTRESLIHATEIHGEKVIPIQAGKTLLDDAFSNIPNISQGETRRFSIF